MKTLFLILTLAISTFALDVTAPTMTDSGTFDVPITMANSDDSIIAYQFSLRYNPAVITPTACTSVTTLIVICNPVDGVLYVAAYGAYPIGDGVIMNVTVQGNEGSTRLVFEDARFFDSKGDVDVWSSNGTVTVE